MVTPLKAFRFRLHPGIDAYEEYDALMPEAADVHAESYAAPPVEYGGRLNTAAAVLHAAAAEETAWSWRPGILARCSAARFISMEFLSWRRMPLMEVGRASHRPQRCRQLFMWESVHVGVVCGVLKLSLTAV